MTVNGTIVERLEPLLGLCLGGCSPVEPRYAVVQHVRLWMPLLFSPASDRQTHLLLRMFSEMKHGCRDTYFLPLIKKPVCSENTGLSMVTSNARCGRCSDRLLPIISSTANISTIMQFSKCTISYIQSVLLIDCDSISLPSFSIV